MAFQNLTRNVLFLAWQPVGLVAQVKQAHDVNYLLEIIFYSEEEEEKDMKKSQREPTSEVLKQAGTDFCENTSLHGFSYWVSDGKYS